MNHAGHHAALRHSPAVITIIILKFYYTLFKNCQAFSYCKVDKGSFTCAMTLVHTVRMKVNKALKILQKSWLRGTRKGPSPDLAMTGSPTLATGFMVQHIGQLHSPLPFPIYLITNLDFCPLASPTLASGFMVQHIGQLHSPLPFPIYLITNLDFCPLASPTLATGFMVQHIGQLHPLPLPHLPHNKSGLLSSS